MKHIIVLPVYNDWRSLNKLLSKLDKCLIQKKFITNEILIVNDNSSKEISLKKKKYKSIKKIRVIFLNQNLGSQKAIAIGLEYLKKFNENFFITVMDSDGEDDPNQVKKMLEKAIRNPNAIVTSNRKQREEPLIIISLYGVLGVFEPIIGSSPSCISIPLLFEKSNSLGMILFQ